MSKINTKKPSAFEVQSHTWLYKLWVSRLFEHTVYISPFMIVSGKLNKYLLTMLVKVRPTVFFYNFDHQDNLPSRCVFSI